jgi:SagB-type dehydrogenase family enzyme
MQILFAAQDEIIALPQPHKSGEYSLEQLLQQRRSIREYAQTPLSLADVSQLLWAAQGITHDGGHRTAPSAGALYPLELYVVVGKVDDLASGVYHYQPHGQRLQLTASGDVRGALAHAALGQEWVRQAAAVVVVTADYERTTDKYGKRGQRYVHIEAGHAAENLFLEVESLGLATVVVGAFNDDAVARVLALPKDQEPVLLLPVGRKK